VQNHVYIAKRADAGPTSKFGRTGQQDTGRSSSYIPFTRIRFHHPGSGAALCYFTELALNQLRERHFACTNEQSVLRFLDGTDKRKKTVIAFESGGAGKGDSENRRSRTIQLATATIVGPVRARYHYKTWRTLLIGSHLSDMDTTLGSLVADSN
jgi:hypothetical protein